MGVRDEDFLTELEEYTSERGLSIAMEAEELEGKYRVATDGFLSQEECHLLMQLAEVCFVYFPVDLHKTFVLQMGATKGDGYKQESPHTHYEMFEGLTISKAAEV
jgi:hypothetical protein